MPDASSVSTKHYLSPPSSARKFDRGLTWLWDKVRNDSDFPRPIYIGAKSPVFLESDLDAWVEKQAAKFARSA